MKQERLVVAKSVFHDMSKSKAWQASADMNT